MAPIDRTVRWTARLFAACLIVGGIACATRTPIDPYLAARLGELTPRVNVLDIVERRLPDGTMRIAVTAQSAVSYSQALRYRVRWYDGSDQPIKTSVSAWQLRNVDADRRFEFIAVSPGPRAARYAVDILPN